MNYETFKDELIRHLKLHYPEPTYDISTRQIRKNNGLVLDGLCIFKEKATMSPTIYLNSYYEQYKNGSNLSDLLVEVIREYELGLRTAPVFQPINSYYETVQRQIILRLVNYEKNREILEDCPYIPFYDLAITFRWLAHWDEIGISTALITNAEMEQWGVDVDQLYTDAISNTMRIFPADIFDLKKLVDQKRLSTRKHGIELFVLTNTSGLNGATSILYKDVLRRFSAKKKANLFLLPSSIHEVILCPEQKGVSENMLLSLVREANHMVVTMGEVLSDNIYYYDYHQDHIYFIEEAYKG